jgi:hypothetical protein
MDSVPARRSKRMAKRKRTQIRVSRAKVTDDDATIYAILREEFTAADLQRYTEPEPMIPAEQVLAKLDEVHAKRSRKRKA